MQKHVTAEHTILLLHLIATFVYILDGFAGNRFSNKTVRLMQTPGLVRDCAQYNKKANTSDFISRMIADRFLSLVSGTY